MPICIIAPSLISVIRIQNKVNSQSCKSPYLETTTSCKCHVITLKCLIKCSLRNIKRCGRRWHSGRDTAHWGRGAAPVEEKEREEDIFPRRKGGVGNETINNNGKSLKCPSGSPFSLRGGWPPRPWPTAPCRSDPCCLAGPLSLHAARHLPTPARPASS